MRPSFQIGGRLAADPEKNGEVVKFRIAVDYYDYKTKQRSAEFYGVTMFGKSGEFIAQYGTKGGWVEARGELRQNEWNDKAGQKRRDIQLIADEAELGPKSQGGVSSAPVPWQSEPGRVDAPADDPFDFR